MKTKKTLLLAQTLLFTMIAMITISYTYAGNTQKNINEYFVTLKGRDAKNRTITIDKAELLFSGQDDARIKELGEDPNMLDNDYMFFDPEEVEETITIARDINIEIIDWDKDLERISIPVKKFLESGEYEDRIFHITIEDNQVKTMGEQYLP